MSIQPAAVTEDSPALCHALSWHRIEQAAASDNPSASTDMACLTRWRTCQLATLVVVASAYFQHNSKQSTS